MTRALVLAILSCLGPVSAAAEVVIDELVELMEACHEVVATRSGEPLFSLGYERAPCEGQCDTPSTRTREGFDLNISMGPTIEGTYYCHIKGAFMAGSQPLTWEAGRRSGLEWALGTSIRGPSILEGRICEGTRFPVNILIEPRTVYDVDRFITSPELFNFFSWEAEPGACPGPKGVS